MDAALPPVFEALIVPHRSLSARGVRRLVAFVALLCGLTGLRFWLLGAWPVAAFAVVEVGLAAFLIHLNARRARARELLLLTEAGMRVVRTDMDGRRVERLLPAAWLSATLEERPGRVPALWLVAPGTREEVARALGEDEKRDLADALTEALHRFRNPLFDNAQLRP
jgi:uncharacterized membrane protein